MDLLILGIIVFLVALIFLLSGMPIAFALGFVSLLFIAFMLGSAELNLVSLRVFEGLNDFSLLAIPLFILLGAVIGGSRANEDLYEAVHRWLYRLPGGIGVTNIVCCAIFAALCGSSPATAAAIGKMGIPEMRKRGYSNTLATGIIAAGGTLGILIPPSVTMIVYGISTQTSIGKLFIAGIIPGLLLTGLFAIWTVFCQYSESKKAAFKMPHVVETSFKGYTWKEKFIALPKVIPFVVIILLIMGSLYLGWATPSECAAVGAIAALLIVSLIYRPSKKDYTTILEDAVKDSVMIMMIIATGYLFGVVLSKLYISQTIANTIIALNLPPWSLMLVINLFLLLLGCFMPPVAIILIVCPILYPIILAAGFDPIWFGVVVTINMEAGCITPPVGLNLYIIKRIAPDIPISDVLRGSIPFIIMMFITIIILYFFPQLALWLPSQMITR
ncbi:MAG: TRAP transporter large permease [Candidatus Bathyarchaeota archaeon]